MSPPEKLARAFAYPMTDPLEQVLPAAARLRVEDLLDKAIADVARDNE